MFGSVWGDQLVLHNYCVIISEFLMEYRISENARQFVRYQIVFGFLYFSQLQILLVCVQARNPNTP